MAFAIDMVKVPTIDMQVVIIILKSTIMSRHMNQITKEESVPLPSNDPQRGSRMRFHYGKYSENSGILGAHKGTSFRDSNCDML